jgi:hypothetical protein
MARTRAQLAVALKDDDPIEDHEILCLKVLLDGSIARIRANLTQDQRSSLPQTSRRIRTITDTDGLQPNLARKKQRIAADTARDTVNQTKADEPNDPISFWVKEQRWPSAYNPPDMERALARKRSLISLGRKRSSSTSSTTTPSDQRPREEKSAPYRDPRYKALLATKGSFMDESDQGIAAESRKTISMLLTVKSSVPTDSLFRDDLFKQTCRSVEDQNEARVLRDITPLIVPSAEILSIYGAVGLKCLIESTNEGWNNSIPLTGPRPQSDYSVGFRREAFTDDQLEKLSPFIGDFIAGDLSFFMATYYMYFPFLACEVKCGAAALDIADRQNAHSMTLATRGIVELFRLVKREHEINQQILGFSISHDHQSVRIYGYYPVIERKDTKYYRHPIRKYDFTELDGKDKWTAYQFTKNIYDIWMPEHFKRICSAIDELPPAIDFDVPALSASTGISHDFENHRPTPEAHSPSLLNENT